ncbi:MAG: WD40 repeat domain-containing protein, partial [Phycisphaerales bacterium]
VDLARGTVDAFSVPERVEWGACISGDGKRAYVAAASGTIYVRDEADKAAGVRPIASVGELSLKMLEGMDGRLLLVAHGGASLSTVDTASGVVRTTRIADAVRLVRGLAWDRKSRAFVAVSSGSVFEVEVREGEAPALRETTVPARVAGGVVAMSMSPDGSLLALGTYYGELSFVDARTGVELGGCSVRHDIWSIAFSQDGQKVAVGDRGGNITEFAAPSGALLESYGVYSPDPAWATGYAFDGRIVANVGPAVHVIDSSPAWSERMEDCPAPVAVAFGVCAAEGGLPERIRVLAPSGEALELKPDSGRWSKLRLAVEQPSRVGAFDAQARRLASWSEDTLILHDLSDGSMRSLRMPRVSMGSVSWSPDASRLVLADRSGVACLLADGSLARAPGGLGANMGYRVEWIDGDNFVLFDFPGVATHYEIKNGALRAAEGFQTESTQSPRRLGGRWVLPLLNGTVIVSAAGGVELLSSVRTRGAMQLLGHRDVTRTVDMAPDGTLLASGGFDGTVRIWDLAEGTTMVTLSVSNRPIQFVRWIDGKRALIAIDYAGGVRFFDSVSRLDRSNASMRRGG